MHGFSGLEGVSGVIQRNEHFGGPIEEKVSDLEGLEGLEAWKCMDFQGCKVCRMLSGVMNISVALEWKAWKAWKCMDFQVGKAAEGVGDVTWTFR